MRRAAAVLSTLFLLSGCELVKSLQNRKVLAAAVVATPEVAPTQVPGYPQGFPAVPAKVTAQLYFGERQDDLTNGGAAKPPVGIDGATVTVRYSDAAGVAKVVTLKHVDGSNAGQYQASAADGLAYVPNATYEFKVLSGGEEFDGSVIAPAPAHVNEFPAQRFEAFDSYAAFDHLTLSFSRTGDDLAFYAVSKVDPAHPQSSFDDVTCSDLPISAKTDPSQLVDLILDTSKWHQSSYTLYKTSGNAEQSCFPEAPAAGAPIAYAVGLGIGRKGTVSDNLFSASTVFAGSMDAAAVVFPH